MSDLTLLDKLRELREHSGPAATTGLPDAVLTRFAALDPSLPRAVDEAWRTHRELRGRYGEALGREERDLGAWLQADYVNFYGPAAVNPYVAIAARGPWIVTSHGAVLHDNGGYGMLGFGHSPDEVLAALARPWVIANIMTPSFTHRAFADALRREVGHTRADGCPYARFLCMNSGSESVTVAMRIADIRAHELTAPGARHEGRSAKILALKGGFHGRTDRPAQASDSTQPAYRANLKTFEHRHNLVTVTPNDVDELREAFAHAEREGWYFEIVMMEPVMGEGNPGQGITRAFYDEARRLSREMGSLLLIDSIQAGLRAHGVLSFVDYPGFADADPPDLETWSKAINAAQYPLSVLACSEVAADTYVTGVYGNTMTANPRGLEVGASVLAMLTPEVRQNVVDRGRQLVEVLEGVAEELPGVITRVQGTGLLVAAHLDPDRYPVVGFGGVEELARQRGLGIIHGGKNALRFTPHFRITSEEVELVGELVRDTLLAYAERAAAK